ncbi:hypothetical protein CoNPh26_CDS0123 [Staphylococcus phage S-CoN_Ph26]|nr:hypothetical protein CoNPh26_CDS0123 [Staphylococcus phage S-CoN_Ph26]
MHSYNRNRITLFSGFLYSNISFVVINDFKSIRCLSLQLIFNLCLNKGLIVSLEPLNILK